MKQFLISVLHEEPLDRLSLDSLKGGGEIVCVCNGEGTTFECTCNGGAQYLCSCNGTSFKCTCNNASYSCSVNDNCDPNRFNPGVGGHV